MKGGGQMQMIDNDLISIQESRILMETARDAQKLLSSYSQDRLDKIVKCMAESVDKYAQELAKISFEETGRGNWEDKYLKNKFASVHLYKHIKDMKCVGIVGKNDDTKTMEIGVPIGVIAAIIPATSPVSTTIYNALIAVKSGNAIVFAPPICAQKSTKKVIDILVEAAQNSGLPEGAISYLQTVTSLGIKELIQHKETSLVLNTGVPEMLNLAHQAGKSVIFGGNGSGPAFVEKTAHLEQAAKDIIMSKTFDNGMVPATEQSIVVDKCIASGFKKHMQDNGAYFMTAAEAESLGNLLFQNGKHSENCIGKSAIELAKMAGFSVPMATKVLVSEQKYVSDRNPYSKEKLCPVLAYYIEDDWQNACEKCIELLLSERHGHTLVIHSNDESVIEQFAIKKPVGRMLVNTPSSYGSIGATTNLFPALSLGSGSAGKGFSTDNISPKNLTYIRKIGYGVTSAESFRSQILSADLSKQTASNNSQADLIESIVMTIMDQMKNEK